MVKPIRIDNRLIGPGNRCFIIAEAGVNHNGSLEIAHKLVDIAADAKADAVKFQTFKTEQLVSRTAPKASYQLETTDANESQFDMTKKLELIPEEFQSLMDHCLDRNIMFLSSPFDDESVDLLGQLGVSAFKIPSGELTNLPYLERIALKGKPMIVSTGMANLSEVEIAVNTIENSGNPPYLLLHCVSNYPADPANVNLKAMATMRTAFNIPVGYSDHTKGIEVALAAVSMGACVIEKHFTLDKNMSGPDHRASLEPEELVVMIEHIRTIESAMGNGRKVPADSEKNTAAVARKSLVATEFLPAGTVLHGSMVAAKRPGTGLSPANRDSVIGRTVIANIMKDQQISLENLS